MKRVLGAGPRDTSSGCFWIKAAASLAWLPQTLITALGWGTWKADNRGPDLQFVMTHSKATHFRVVTVSLAPLFDVRFEIATHTHN